MKGIVEVARRGMRRKAEENRMGELRVFWGG